MAYVEYQGALHIHSAYSDGSGSIRNIAEAGRRAGLDFLTITDHNTLKAREGRWDGWHEGVLVLVGQEVSWGRYNHCIALGIARRIPKLPPDRVIREIRAQGGISLIVHPHGRYRPFLKLRDHGWKAWDVNSYTGMELWSYMFDWARDLRFYKGLEFYRDPEARIKGPEPETLRKWDELCQTKRVVAVGGVDAHARRFLFGAFVVFPYEYLFRTVRTHVLIEGGFSGEARRDQQALLNALSSGHCFIGHDLRWESRGFRLRLTGGEGEAIMGDLALWREGLRLETHLPGRATLRVLRDGRPLVELETEEYALPVERPGVYRVEARVEGQPWIYSNPIYVRAEGQGNNGEDDR